MLHYSTTALTVTSVKRKLDFVTGSDGTRVPFEVFITMTPLEQHSFLCVRGVKRSADWIIKNRLSHTKQRREVVTPLGEFSSMSEAAKAHGLWGSNGIKLRIERGWDGYYYK